MGKHDKMKRAKVLRNELAAKKQKVEKPQPKPDDYDWEKMT